MSKFKIGDAVRFKLGPSAPLKVCSVMTIYNLVNEQNELCHIGIPEREIEPVPEVHFVRIYIDRGGVEKYKLPDQQDAFAGTIAMLTAERKDFQVEYQ